MKRMLLTLKYKGTKYQGYQVQGTKPTIAKAVQDAIEVVFGERLDLTGCSRTDSGVHANEYFAIIDSTKNIPEKAIVITLNQNLPVDIAVLDCTEVSADFHPRYCCKGKRYLYKIHNSRIRDPFLEGLVYRYSQYLDEKLMNRAAQNFIGTYDFKAFSNVGNPIEDTVRTIFEFDVWREKDMVYLAVHGDGFLYNMVRIMVGTLIGVSQGKIQSDRVKTIIESKQRKLAGNTVPAEGLYLDRVFY